MKNGLMLAILSAALGASAYDVGGVVGAWAFADDTNRTAVVVVEHHMAWALEGGRWRPLRLGELARGTDAVGALLLPLERGASPAYSIAKTDRSSDRVLFAKGCGVCEQNGGRVMARTEMPDWERVCGLGGFVGTWRVEKSPDSALIVRADGTAVIVPVNPAADNGQGCELSQEFDWRRDCAGIRLFERVSGDDEGSGPSNPGVMALRPDAKSADIACPPSLFGVAVRSAAKVPDPLDIRRKMAADASYHGMWMLKDRENGYSFYISPKGRGILVSLKLGPEKLLPFDWKVADGGKVHCVVFTDFAARAKCPFAEFDFVYHPEPNEMELIIPSDAPGSALRATLAFFNWNEMVDQVIEMAKKRE